MTRKLFEDEEKPAPPERSLKDQVREGGLMIGKAALAALQQKLDERLYDLEALQVTLPRGGAAFGFGKRVLVPVDQVHIVTGHGLHSSPFTLSKKTEIFGSAAGRPAVYRRNSLTITTGLSTLTFVIPIAGSDHTGVAVLDRDETPYTVTTHVIARLNRNQALKAAQSVGDDIVGFAASVREITESQILNAAAQYTLEEVMDSRQVLAEKAREAVNTTLQDLGYELVLITIAELGGTAYEKKVEQSLAKVTRDSTVAINTADFKTTESTQQRERDEANMKAKTAEQVALDEAEKDEKVNQRQHTLALENAKRSKLLADEQAVVNESKQNHEKALEFKATEDDAKRLAEEQSKQIERDDEISSAKSERGKLVTTTAAQATAEALKIEALGASDAAQSQAAAAIKRAEGKRAEFAAEGLANADVRAREVEIAAAQVEVTKAEGLARVEVQEKLAALFVKNPALFELETLKVKNEHALAMETARLNAQTTIMQALAPNININLIGDGGKVSQIMASVMQIASGANHLGEQIPSLNNLMGGASSPLVAGLDFTAMFEGFMPFIRNLVKEMNPRMFGRLTLAELAEHLAPVIEGRSDLVTALNGLRESTGFRMIADLPIASLLERLGITPMEASVEEAESHDGGKKKKSES